MLRGVSCCHMQNACNSCPQSGRAGNAKLSYFHVLCDILLWNVLEIVERLSQSIYEIGVVAQLSVDARKTMGDVNSHATMHNSSPPK